MSLPRATETFANTGEVEFSTRFIQLTNAPATTILPYVLSVLEGVGAGVAQAVGGIGANGGILLTTPVGISHFLESVIVKNLDVAGLGEFSHSIFYPPAFIIPTSSSGIRDAIGMLNLLPPDMTCQVIAVDSDRSALIVSGFQSRLDKFKSDILPSIQSLVANFSKPGFPGA